MPMMYVSCAHLKKIFFYSCHGDDITETNNNNNNTRSKCALSTPEGHVQHQEWAAGWNTCRPSD